jgi:very-short-patch-repair endonuclease
MARPMPAFDLDKAIELYQSPMTVTAAAKIVGTSRESLKLQLGKRGLLRPQPHKLITDEIISSYLAGEEYKSISARTGIAESVLKVRFKKLGILRGQKSVRVPQEVFDRYASGETATDLARELGISVNTMIRRFREAGIARPISSREEMFAAFLRERGIAFEHPLTLGSYKIDFSFPEDRIAVEIDAEWGNRVRSSGRSLYEERCEYILSSGWDLVEIRCRGGIASGAADYVISLLEQPRRDPSTRGEYRVVGGDGKAPSASSYEFNNWSVVASTEAST